MKYDSWNIVFHWQHMLTLNFYEVIGERKECKNTSLYDKNLKNFHQKCFSWFTPYKMFSSVTMLDVFIFAAFFFQKCCHTPFPQRWLYLTIRRSLVTWLNWQTTINIYALQFLHPFKGEVSNTVLPYFFLIVSTWLKKNINI